MLSVVGGDAVVEFGKNYCSTYLLYSAHTSEEKYYKSWSLFITHVKNLSF